MLQDIRVRQRELLLQLLRLMTQELDLESLLTRLLRISIELLSGTSGFIALHESDRVWSIKAVYGLANAMVRYIETYLARLCDESEVSGASFRPIAINLLIERIVRNEEFGVVDGIGLPLVINGQSIGMIVIFRTFRTKFSIDDAMLLKDFAGQAAVAVRNAALYTENLRGKMQTDAILDALSEGILVMDSGSMVTRANPALNQLFAVETGYFSGRHHDEVIRLTGTISGMTLAQGIAGGWPFTGRSKLTVEGDLILRDDPLRTVPVSIVYVPILSGKNHLLNIIASVRDISKFREADALKNTFISTVSHELKTPVALIKGYASTMRLADGKWAKDLLDESLMVIEEEADRLTELINDLLDASRMMSGTLKLHRIEFDLKRLCERVASRQQSQTDRHRIVSEFPAQFPIVNADSDRIEQVITNLLTNAIKYTAGGEIRIRGEVIGTTETDRFVSISVSDEGEGLAPDELPYLFDKFYRVSKTATSAKGVGLGLYICAAIVRGHGGKISVANRTDRSGAVFTFTLPLHVESGLDYFYLPRSDGNS